MTIDAAKHAWPTYDQCTRPGCRDATGALLEQRALRHMDAAERVAYRRAAARGDVRALMDIIGAAVGRVEQAITALAWPSSHGAH